MFITRFKHFKKDRWFKGHRKRNVKQFKNYFTAL